MTTYIVKFSTEAEHGSCDIDADTPQQALQLARKALENDPDAIDWEHYCGRQGLTDITILDESEGVLLEWNDPDESVRRAAPELLEALQQAVTALNTAPRFNVPGLGTDSYEIAAICDRAISAAKPQQP
jgi:hypothetical protein